MPAQPLGLNFYFYTTGQVELAQRINRTAAAGVNVQQALVRVQLKLLTRFFINVWRTQHRKYFLVCGQWNGASNYCAGTTYSFHYLFCRLINQVVVVRL